jgi:predicted O-methyltransferase YrrM
MKRNDLLIREFVKAKLLVDAWRLRHRKWSSLTELVDAAYKYIPPDQNPQELLAILCLLKQRKPEIRNALEIGTGNGCMAYLVTQIFPECLFLTIDSNLWGVQQFYVNHLGKHIITEHLDSHLESTRREIATKAWPIDFLFIDGDHSYEGVKKDYAMYSPFLSKENLTVFHDIKDSKLGVGKFWRKLSGNKTEFTFDSRDKYGVGVLTK